MVDQEILTISLKQNSLFFAFFFTALVDAVITVIGQKGGYWLNLPVVSDSIPT